MAESGLTNVTEGFQKARDDAERAIALDPTLTSAYLALAKTHINCDWNWDAANASNSIAAPIESAAPVPRSWPSRTSIFRACNSVPNLCGTGPRKLGTVKGNPSGNNSAKILLLRTGFGIRLDSGKELCVLHGPNHGIGRSKSISISGQSSRHIPI